MTAFKHGKYYTRIYRIYNDMKKRCYNHSMINYKNYGGRGIKVCDEWRNDFMNFYNWAMNNGYTDNLTIERIDVDGNYEPNNCKWITYKEQANNRRNNVHLTYAGKTQTMKQWAEELDIKYSTIVTRHRRGYNDKECLFGKSRNSMYD